MSAIHAILLGSQYNKDGGSKSWPPPIDNDPPFGVPEGVYNITSDTYWERGWWKPFQGDIRGTLDVSWDQLDKRWRFDTRRIPTQDATEMEVDCMLAPEFKTAYIKSKPILDENLVGLWDFFVVVRVEQEAVCYSGFNWPLSNLSLFKIDGEYEGGRPSQDPRVSGIFWRATTNPPEQVGAMAYASSDGPGPFEGPPSDGILGTTIFPGTYNVPDVPGQLNLGLDYVGRGCRGDILYIGVREA